MKRTELARGRMDIKEQELVKHHTHVTWDSQTSSCIPGGCMLG